jgi:hypothetical protein
MDHFNNLEGRLFLMEVLEVFRRWIWIFLRVEAEWGRFSYSARDEIVAYTDFLAVRNNKGLDPSDVLLGEYPKYDSD